MHLNMISTIICTYNREQYIRQVLEALTDTDFHDYEILVVDNNSTDSTPLIVGEFITSHPTMRVKLLHETRQGLSHARNCGLANAGGDLIIFLDDDAIPCRNYLALAAQSMSRHPQAGAFGGRIIPVFEGGKPPKWLCRWSLSWVSGLDYAKGTCRFSRDKYPIGANMGFRRETLDCLSEGFNAELGRNAGNMMAGEEKEIFGRLSRAGIEVYYFPEVKVQHMIPQSRTTTDYVRRFADGVGRSERLRTQKEGSYPRRLLSEALKWIATFVLSIGYLLIGRPTCATTLVLFRAHVTRSLLGAK